MKCRFIKQGAILILAMMLLGGCSKETAGSNYKEGMKYFQSGNYDEAEKSLAKAIDLNGDKAEYYIDYGMNMIQLSKYDEAITSFEKAIQDKKNLIVHKNNKLALRGEGIAYLKAHKYKESIQKFEDALKIRELDKLDLDILYYKGNAQIKAGFYEEAVAVYTNIIKKKAGDSTSYSARGDIYRRLGKFDESLADYNKAIDLDKNNYDFYIGKYFLMIDKEDAAGAKEVLKKALSIKGASEKDKYNISKVNYYLEDYDKATLGFLDASKNGFFEANYFLGDISEKKGDYETAIKNYTLYIENEPAIESAAVYNQIANCYIKLSKYKEALPYIEAGIELNDLNIKQALKRNEIVVNEHLSNFEKAYKLMKNYVKAYPEDKSAAKELIFLQTRLPDSVLIKKEK